MLLRSEQKKEVPYCEESIFPDYRKQHFPYYFQIEDESKIWSGVSLRLGLITEFQSQSWDGGLLNTVCSNGARVAFDSSHHPPCFQWEHMGGEKMKSRAQ